MRARSKPIPVVISWRPTSVVEVSVITTSMNYGRFLEQNIKSVRAQVAPFKFKVNHIIMDGGSKDGTPEILEKYRDHVHSYVVPGEGQTLALNHAMKIIEEEFPETDCIGWLNADDYYRPNWLRDSVSTLMSGGEMLAMTCGGRGLDPLPRKPAPKKGPAKPAKMVRKRKIKTSVGLERMLKGNRVCQPTVCIKFSAFKAIKERDGFYWDPQWNYCQDLEVWLRFLIHGFRIRRIQPVVAMLRMHPSRMTHTHKKQQKDEDAAVRKFMIKKIRRLRKKK